MIDFFIGVLSGWILTTDEGKKFANNTIQKSAGFAKEQIKKKWNTKENAK